MQGWSEALVWLSDLVVGGMFLVAGAIAWRRFRSTSVLLGLTGLTWLLGDLVPSAVFWHRATLVHALLAYPGWWPTMGLSRFVVVLTYVLAVVSPGFYENGAAGIAHATVVAGVGWWAMRHAEGREKHHRRFARNAAVALAAVPALGSVARD